MYVYNRIPTELLESIIATQLELPIPEDIKYIVIKKENEGQYGFMLCYGEFQTFSLFDIAKIVGIKVLSNGKTTETNY